FIQKLQLTRNLLKPIKGLLNKYKGDRVRVLLGEGNMARQCTQPKRLRNSVWFKEKMLLVQEQESDCDDISLAKAILIANLSSYNSDVVDPTSID
ncbi:hypothetical protein Tco_1238995, partial [Tanacetum coccineum]